MDTSCCSWRTLTTICPSAWQNVFEHSLAQREQRSWSGTRSRSHKFSFPIFFLLNGYPFLTRVFWVWLCRFLPYWHRILHTEFHYLIYMRESELITQANGFQFYQYVIWWEINPLYNTCNNKATELQKGLFQMGALLFSLQLCRSELPHKLDTGLCFWQAGQKHIPHFGKSPFQQCRFSFHFQNSLSAKGLVSANELKVRSTAGWPALKDMNNSWMKRKPEHAEQDFLPLSYNRLNAVFLLWSRYWENVSLNSLWLTVHWQLIAGMLYKQCALDNLFSITFLINVKKLALHSIRHRKISEAHWIHCSVPLVWGYPGSPLGWRSSKIPSSLWS